MKKVAIYARVSTEHEAQVNSLKNQIEFYDDILAKHDDFVLYKRYIDEGITGTSIKKRKSFKRMIEDAKTGCFDLIITREVSRFARNTVDTLEKSRELRRIGVEIYFISENIWTIQDPDADLKLTIMAMMAQNESKSTSERVKAGQSVSFKKKVYYGTGNILGYDRLGKKMVINEEQAKTVRLIFDLCLQGNGSRMIQYELERRGCTTSTGLTSWNPATIVGILKNSFYCGTIVYRKSYIPDYLDQKPKKNNGEVPQVIVEGNHETIVTKEEYTKVQEILQSHRTNGKNTLRGKLPTTVYGKKIVCSCGSSMQQKTYHKYADGHRTMCYQCYGQINSGSYTSRMKNGVSVDNVCNTKMIPQWKLKAIAYMVFDKILSEKDEILDIIDSLLESAINEDDRNDELVTLEKKLESLKRKSDKLLDTYLSDFLSKEEYSEKKQAIDDEIDSLSIRLDDMKNDAQPIITAEQRLKTCKSSIRDKFNYKRGELSEELVDSFVDKIIVSNDLIKWYLNFGTDTSKHLNDASDESIEDNKILLGKLLITKDDVNAYSKYDEELSNVRLKQPFEVEIYI